MQWNSALPRAAYTSLALGLCLLFMTQLSEFIYIQFQAGQWLAAWFSIACCTKGHRRKARRMISESSRARTISMK